MEKRERFGQIFIYLILILWFGAEVLTSSTIKKIFIWDARDFDNSFSIIVLVLLMLQIVFFQKYQFKELVVIALITIPIVFATINSGNNRMMSTWIFIVAAKYIDFDKIARLAYVVGLIMVLFVLYLFFNGFITEVAVYRGSLLRHSLGFGHPNQLGIRIFLLIISRCYIRREHFNLIDWSIIIAAAVFVNRVANSKTSFYALVILSVLTLVHIAMQKTGIGFDRIMSMLIAISLLCNIISITLSSIQVSQYPILRQFDLLMSKRFSECNRTLKYYGIKLFGQDIQLLVNRPAIGRMYHFWLDNAYMTILLRYGPVVLILFSALYIYTMIMLKNMNQYMLVEIMCLYAIYGIMENNFFSMSQNLFLLLLSYPLYKHAEIMTQKKTRRRVQIVW